MRTSAHCAILRVKSPPHLEPWDIQRVLEHGFAAKRRENASAPQNGISSQTQQGIPPQDFKTISPQGDGNYLTDHFQWYHIHISKPYPRKGTETQSNTSPKSKTFYNFKTISPQGDGNCSPFCRRNGFSFISKPYPRKGTETISLMSIISPPI